MSNPVVSILTPVFKSDLAHLRLCIGSVLDQTDGRWELILVDDASGDPRITELLAAFSKLDQRVRVHTRFTNAGIVGASNDALELATGTVVAFLDHDDVLERTAVAEVVRYVNAYPAAEVFYSDRGHIDADGNPCQEDFLKPDWSPERLRGNMYIAHLTVLNREAALAVGGFHQEYEGAQDHDLVLRVTERGRAVIHIPKVLYQWRSTPRSTASNADAKPYARTAGLRAVTDHCERLGIPAAPTLSNHPGWYWLHRTPERPVRVSIIIPTRGSRGKVFGEDRCLVAEVVKSVCGVEHAVDYEIVIVHDTNNDQSYLDQAVANGMGCVRLIPFTEPFNFSKKINLGALHATGEMLLLLNDDIEPITAGWLDHLTAIALSPKVACVGAKLLFENGLVQHGGIAVRDQGVYNAFTEQPDHGGYFGSLVVDHEATGVTAACLAIRKLVFFELGGLCEDLPSSFNDVDLCLKALGAGYSNVAANSIQLYHFESLSRDPRVSMYEHAFLLGRWSSQLDHDAYLRGRGKAS